MGWLLASIMEWLTKPRSSSEIVAGPIGFQAFVFLKLMLSSIAAVLASTSTAE
jgi:hypothetical protein